MNNGKKKTKIKICSECGSRMTVEKISKVKHRESKYNVTRWVCICENVDTVWGSGIRDGLNTD